MSQTWSQVKLGQVVTPSKIRYDPKDGKKYVYVGLEHIGKGTGSVIDHGDSSEIRSLKSVFGKGDLLYGKLRPYLNKVAIAPFAGICSTDILVLPASDKISSRFLMYRMLQRDFVNYAQLHSSGVQHPRVKFQSLSNFPLELPPLNEQEKIVAKIEELFSEIDDSINSFMATKSHLSMYKASVLDKAFKRVMEEFPECVKNIGEAYKVYVGATPARKETSYWNGDINWVSSGEVAFKDIRNTKEKITPVGLARTSTRLHPPGTVMLAMIGEGKTRGQTGILKIHAAHNQNTAAIEVDNDQDVSEYLYYYLMSEYDRTRSIGSGNNQKALNKSRVEAMKIPLPSKQTQQNVVLRIAETLSHIEELSITVCDSLERNHTLKQAILSKAFKGDLV